MRSLFIWSRDSEIIYRRGGSNPLWYRNFCIYHRDIFPVRNYGSFSRGTPWYGSFNSTDDLIRYWYSGNKNCMGVLVVPGSPFAGISVYFISGIMAHYNCDASYLLLFCEEKSAWVTVGYAKI